MLLVSQDKLYYGSIHISITDVNVFHFMVLNQTLWLWTKVYRKALRWGHCFFPYLLMICPQFVPIVKFNYMLTTQSSTSQIQISHKFNRHYRLTSILFRSGFILIGFCWIERNESVCSFPNPLSLSLQFSGGSPIETVKEFKYLGLWLDCQLSFKTHINSVVQKINYSLKILYCSIQCFTLQIRKRIITQLILPILDYGDTVYQNTTETNLYPLNVTYNNLCRFILRCPYRTHHCTMYETLNWLSPKSRRYCHWMHLTFKCIFFNFPPYLKQLLERYTPPYNLRHTDHPYFTVPRATLECGRRAFKFKAPNDWNALPSSLRSITSFNMFKQALLTHTHTPCSCF